MSKWLIAIASSLLCLASCANNSTSQNIGQDDSYKEDDPYKDVPPLFDGDSLLAVYPLASQNNPIQVKEFDAAMLAQILKNVGTHVECLEIQPWKVDKIADGFSPDSFHVSFTPVATRNIKLSTRLPKATAENLDRFEWYEVKGIFTGFPPRKELQPHIHWEEIDLGVLEYDSTEVKIFPDDKRDYWRQ